MAVLMALERRFMPLVACLLRLSGLTYSLTHHTTNITSGASRNSNSGRRQSLQGFIRTPPPDMHHPVSGINSLIHSVSLASHVSTHLLIHLSAHLCHHHHSHHSSITPSLFRYRLKPTFSTNASLLNTSTLDCLHDRRVSRRLNDFSAGL